MLGPADYMKKVAASNFRAQWDELKSGAVVLSFALDKSVEGVVKAVSSFLGMKLCEGTGKVAAGARQHSALLSGKFLGGVQVLARMQVLSKGKQKSVLKVGCGFRVAACWILALFSFLTTLCCSLIRCAQIGVCAEDAAVANIVAHCISG